MLPDAVIVSPQIAIYGLVTYPLVLYYLWLNKIQNVVSVILEC